MTTQQENFIKQNSLKISGNKMAKMLGLNAGVVKRFIDKNCNKPGKEQIRKWRIESQLAVR